MQLVLVTGGDDCAIHVTLLASQDQAHQARWTLEASQSIPSAHTSAVKVRGDCQSGIVVGHLYCICFVAMLEYKVGCLMSMLIVHLPLNIIQACNACNVVLQGIWTNGSRLLSTGLDQRVHSWHIQSAPAAPLEPSAAPQNLLSSTKAAGSVDDRASDQSSFGEPHFNSSAAHGNAVLEEFTNPRESLQVSGGLAPRSCGLSFCKQVKQLLQVLEPSGLQVLAGCESASLSLDAVLAMVTGRGTQILS